MYALRVDALFSDYDGTLAREDVPREDSAIPPELDGALRRVAKDVAVAIVTSKDYEFIRPRTPFARAWGCVSGLEVVADGAARLTSAPSVDLETMISETRGLLTGAQLEEKRSSRGLLLGFCIDWRGGPKPTGLDGVLDELRRRGLYVEHGGSRQYADVFASEPTKGKAVTAIRKELGLKGALIFLGDSRWDNSAFRAADVAVGVAHGQRMGDLECDYWVESEGLTPFLESLTDSGYEFSDGLPGIHQK